MFRMLVARGFLLTLQILRWRLGMELENFLMMNPVEVTLTERNCI